MKKTSGGRSQSDSGTTKQEGLKMELVLSIAFGAWFVASALFYGYMVRKGEKE